ncbi:unnamed protein product [Arabis nemorensis]|uniref:Neprosin activation peptide domain-containing protein n=1 Tax=Arabis nemorensis TaxID=586526 RepID=A0A565C735_9BRAS|nr:unnamed protein product [Arabis nemorensis]
MIMTNIIYICLIKMASLNNCLVDAKTLQSFNNFETEEQLTIINTTYGDTYACVDFYKQPAIDHPSMKNYSIRYKMRLTSSLRNSKINNKKFGYLWENGIGCLIGTIPIKRATKNELVKLDLFSETYRPQGSWNFNDIQSKVHSDQHHFAVSRTKEEQGKSYTGASMMLSVNDPRAGENQCYNNMCSGGIITVRSDIPLGHVLAPPGIRGSNTFISRYALHKASQIVI